MKLKPANHTNCFIFRFGDDGYFDELSKSVIAVNPAWNAADGFTITVILRDTKDGQVIDAIDDFRANGLPMMRLTIYDKRAQDRELLRCEDYTDVTVKSWSREFDYRDNDEVHHTVVFSARSMTPDE